MLYYVPLWKKITRNKLGDHKQAIKSNTRKVSAGVEKNTVYQEPILFRTVVLLILFYQLHLDLSIPKSLPCIVRMKVIWNYYTHKSL